MTNPRTPATIAAFTALILAACGGSVADADPGPPPGVVKRDVVYNLYDLPHPYQDVIAFCDGGNRVYVSSWPESVGQHSAPVFVDEESVECQ